MSEAPGQDEDAPAPARERRRPSKRAVTIVSIPLVVVTLLSYVGDGIMPGLVDEHPLLLMALNPRNRNLVLVTNQVDAWSYYLVGFLRLILTDPLWFLIGYWYGDTALHWAESRTRTFGETLRWLESGFGKAAYPLVVVAPNNWICLFAGSAGMGLATFLVLNALGTIGRLVTIRLLGDVFESPIDRVLEFIADYRMPLLIVSIVAFGLMALLEYRKGEGDLEGLSRLDEEMAEAAEADAGAGSRTEARPAPRSPADDPS
ncbi:MAG: DedA family protein [Acidimicrobiia bacterium]